MSQESERARLSSKHKQTWDSLSIEGYACNLLCFKTIRRNEVEWTRKKKFRGDTELAIFRSAPRVRNLLVMFWSTPCVQGLLFWSTPCVQDLLFWFIPRVQDLLVMFWSTPCVQNLLCPDPPHAYKTWQPWVYPGAKKEQSCLRPQYPRRGK